MAQIADIAVFNTKRKLILLAEVKTKIDSSKEWAIELHKTLRMYEKIQEIDYFLLALPDRIYVWDEGMSESDDSPPTYEFDGQTILQPYFDKVGVSAETIKKPTFELIVGEWLQGLSSGRNGNAELLQQSAPQLLDELRNSQIEYEAAEL